MLSFFYCTYAQHVISADKAVTVSGFEVTVYVLLTLLHGDVLIQFRNEKRKARGLAIEKLKDLNENNSSPFIYIP